MADERKKTVLQLPYDAVFRIEVSLSSQTTSVIVMRTTATLYCLEGAHTARPRAGDAEWKSLAYGAPCIQLVRRDNLTDAIFTIRIVIAEVESGIALWEGELNSNSRYGAMQNNFHTFTSLDNTYAIQFVSEEEAIRMLESVQDLLSQQLCHQQQGIQQQVATDSVIFKKPSKPPRRLSKKDISSPCNFKHVSGITMQRTSSCEQELRGTIQRKMRSLSLSNLSRSKPTADELPQESVEKKASKRVKSFKRKYSKDVVDGIKRSDPQRMSLPSHFRQRERQSLSSTTFIPPSKQINKTLSHSQGGLPSSIHNTTTASSTSCHTTSFDPSPGHRPINYQTTPTHRHMPTYPSQSDSSLNHVPYHSGPTPVQESKSSTQHVAIASSDIIGWTPDGKLIIKMPTATTTTTAATPVPSSSSSSVAVNHKGNESSTTNLHLTRRASTGQFANDYQSQQRRHGNHGDQERDARPRPPPPTNRPLPLTPLDIAMPQSLALRMKTNPPSIGNKTNHVANGNKANIVTVNNSQSVAIGNTELPTSHIKSSPSDVNEATPTNHSHTESLDDTLEEVTDQMSRALAQFDELLGVVQTSL